MLFFTADEHYWHKNIIIYCQRPFKDIHEMNHELIIRNNSLVSPKDTIYHIGDFTLANETYAREIISQLNGTHVFIRGGHDRWLQKSVPMIIERKISNRHITMCHFPMMSWNKSAHGSWHLFGHTHGDLNGKGVLKPTMLDVGVDNNNFFPYSWLQIENLIKCNIASADDFKVTSLTAHLYKERV